LLRRVTAVSKATT